MSTTKTSTLLIISLLLLLSCKEGEQTSDASSRMYEIDVDALENKEVENISTYFKSVKLIPLETSDNCLIKSMDGIQVTDDYIFILDRSYDRLYCFDKNGKYIRSIGSIGAGPGEFGSIYDFTIDDDEIIYILDSSKNEVYAYSIIGEYKYSIPIGSTGGRSGHIQSHNNILYLDFEPFQKVANESTPLLLKIDKASGELLDTYLTSDEDQLGIQFITFKDGSYFYSRDSKSPYYAPRYSNTIFSLQDSVRPYFKIKSKRLLKKEDMQHIDISHSSSFGDINGIDKIKSILNFLELEDYIICEYYDGYKINTLIYSKANKTAKLNGGFFDDFIYKTFAESIPHYFACSDENGLYSYIGVHDIPYFVDYYKSGKLKLELDPSQKELSIDNITEESNPILFYYELK